MNPNSTNNPIDAKWLSMTEAAAHTPYSAEYLSLLARKGKLVSKKINGVWYTTKSALDDYMQKQMLRAQVLGGTYPAKPVAAETQAVAVTPNAESGSAEDAKYDPATLKHLRSFHADIRAYMLENGLPVPRETENVAANNAQDLFHKHGNAAYAERMIVPEYFPQLEKNEIADTLGAVREETHRGIADTLEKVLDKKLGSGALGRPSMISRVPALPRKSWKTISGSRVLLAMTVVLMIGLTTLPVPFVFSSFENGLGTVKGWVTDANTVMGYRPGTHKDEILLLDKNGDIAINGHIETGGQLQSHIADGTAPIVVDSKTLVGNLNAQYIDGASTTDFTLAFVTKNGSVTTDNVQLLGSVEVGKTLLVKGATKLLNALSVDGDLSVFGNAEFNQALSVLGPAHFQQLVTAEDDLIVNKNISVRGSIDAGGAVLGSSGSFGSLGVQGDLTASGDVALGNTGQTITFSSKTITLDRDGNLSVSGGVNAPVLNVTGSATSTFAGPVYFGGQLAFAGAGVSLPGTTTVTDLLVTGSSTINGLSVVNSTTTNATSTNFFTSSLSAAFAKITSLAASDISVAALTATSSVTNSATTTNATSTTLYADTGTFNDLFVNSYEQNNGTFSIHSTVPTGDIFSVLDTAVTSGTLIHQTLTANAGNGQVSKGQIIDLADNTTAGGGYSALTVNVSGTGTGSGSKTLLDLNPGANKEIVFDASGALRPTTDVSQNVVSIGSPSYYFKNGYFDTITSNNIAGTVTSGDTASHTWTLGSTETGDTSEALVFQRNSGSGNATLSWNASGGTLNDQRFLSVNYPFNDTYTVMDSSIATTTNLYSGLLTNNTTSGTQKLLSLTNTGTGTTEDGIYLNNSGTATNAIEVAGNWTNGLIVGPNAGNVGIGTTNPQAPLDVRNQIFVRNVDGAVGSNDGVEIATDSSAPRVSLVQGGRYVGLYSGDAAGNTYLKNVAGGAFIMTGGSNGGTELARLTNDGNLGIGTTNPNYKLEVNGTASTTNLYATSVTLGSLLLTGSSTLQNFTFGNATGTSATTTNFYSQNFSAGSLSIVNLMFTNATGTNATTTNFASTNASSTNLYAGYLTVGGSNQETDETRASIDQANNTVGLAVGNIQTAVGVSNTTRTAALTLRGVGVKNAQLQMFPTRGNGTLAITGSATQSDRIADQSLLDIALSPDGGNVGVGTLTPGATFEVARSAFPTLRINDLQAGGHMWDLTSGSSTKGYFEITDRTSGGTRLTIDNAGDVGVGLTNPGAKLEVANGGVAITGFSNTNTGANGGEELGFDGTQSVLQSIDRTHSVWKPVMIGGSDIRFQNSGGEYMRLTGGNLGIGTTNPGAHEEIYTTGTTYPTLRLNSNFGGGNTVDFDPYITGQSNNGFNISLNGSSKMVISGTGNVGIGTTNPGAKLEVAGDILFGTTTNTGRIKSDGTNTYLDAIPGGGADIFRTGGAVEAMRITSNGSVGIGTTNPAFRTEIDASGTGDNNILDLNQASGYASGGRNMIRFSQGTSPGSSGQNFRIGYDNDTASFQIRNSSDGVVAAFTSSSLGIGTQNSDAKLNVNGSEVNYTPQGAVYHYHDVASYDNQGGAVTGTIEIQLPAGVSAQDTMNRITIQGYDYSSDGTWEVVIGGYTYGSHDWYNSSVQINGRAPFTQVRLVWDSNTGRNAILLGTTSTTWNYPQITVTDVVEGFDTVAGWGSGWSISLLASESGFTNATALNSDIIDRGGNIGIGTTNPSGPLDVHGYSYFNGLRLNGADGSVNQIYQGNANTTLGITANGGNISFGQGSQQQAILGSNGDFSIGSAASSDVSYPLVLGTTAGVTAETGIKTNVGSYTIYLSHGGWGMGGGKFGIGNGSTPSLVVDTINNRVGILTTSPSYGLDVNTTIGLEGNLTAGATTNNWNDGYNYFRSNKGASSYLGSNSAYNLMAYSSDGGAAAMSFHRGGYYAVNMGLDPDNVLRIGGWSAAANRWQLDMSGNETVAGNLGANGGALTLAGYEIAVSQSSYGTLSLITPKNGYYGLLMGTGSASPNFMFDGNGNGGIYYESAGLWSQFYTRSTNHLSINTSSDMGAALGVNGAITTNSAYLRSSAGTGYLSGAYGSVETTGTTGAIYTIGGSYVPQASSLNNMYGIGYTYTSGQSGLSVTGVPSSNWGMYVASNGTARIFLDSDNGSIYANSDVHAGGSLYSGGMRLVSDSDNYMELLSGNNSVSGLEVMYNNSTRLGYVYGDSSGFGLLSSAGGWALRVGAGSNYVQTIREFYPGTTSQTLQSSWYIAGDSTYGLASNTGFNAAGGLYDAGNRVCSTSTCSLGTPIVRTAAGKGYLSGNYPSVETGATSGAIYSIGGSYVPGTTSLGNMYGVGYSVNNNGTSGFAVSNAPSDWGFYVAAGGTANAFIDGSTGSIYSNGGLTLVGNITAAGAPTSGYNLNVGAIGASTVYGYTALCANNNSGDCSTANGVVLGRSNTSAFTNFPSSGSSFVGGSLGIGTTNPGTALAVAGTISIPHTVVNSGTENGFIYTGGCTASGPTMAILPGYYPSITTSDIFYDTTVGKHARISSVSLCNDGSINHTVLNLTDNTGAGSSSSDGYYVYAPTGDVGNTSNGYIDNLYTLNLKSLNTTVSGGFDLAEQYPTTDSTLDDGDVVSIDPLLPQGVKRSAAGDVAPLGVVSGHAPLTLGDNNDTGWKKIALTGRVDVKVSDENGAIVAGDFLAPSASEGGKLAKATKAGMVLGQALEGEHDGIVKFFVNRFFYDPAEATTTASTTSERVASLELRVSALEGLMGTSTSSALTLDATTTQAITNNVLATIGATIVDSVTHFKDVVVAALTVGSSDLPSGITIYDTATGAPYCITVENGTQRTTPGECSAPTAPATANPVTGDASSTPDTTASSTSSSDTASSTPTTDTSSSTPATDTSTTASSTSPTDTSTSTPSTDTASSTPVVADSGTATSTTP